LEQAHYGLIKAEEPFYGEIKALPGVYATAVIDNVEIKGAESAVAIMPRFLPSEAR
jgi:hypothetical protein